MYKPESVQEKETHKIHWDFRIQPKNQTLS